MSALAAEDIPSDSCTWARGKIEETQNMPDYQALENKFQQILNLSRRPVAVAFRAECARVHAEVLGV